MARSKRTLAAPPEHASAGDLRSTNKNGQLLGRKGMETRKRLMDAARRLLAMRSPFELTALLITREA